MKMLTRACFVVLLSAGCAGTTPFVGEAHCATLEWEECGRTATCRHARAWSEGQETWTCERKPPVAITTPKPPAVAKTTPEE